jgi:hypothetical protein
MVNDPCLALTERPRKFRRRKVYISIKIKHGIVSCNGQYGGTIRRLLAALSKFNMSNRPILREVKMWIERLKSLSSSY